MTRNKRDNRKKRNKGTINYVVVLIFFVILLIILLIFTSRISEKIKEQAKAGECKASVAIFSKLSIKQMKDYPLACPVSHVTITKEEEVFPSVAKEMATLWTNFGAGKLELFSPEDEVFCVLGSHITFAGINKELHGFLPYLAEQSYQKTSYLEYLAGIRLTAAELTSQPQLQAIDKIDTTKPMGIIFRYSKDAKLSKQEGTIMGMHYGSALGIAAGLVTLFYFPPGGVSVLSFILISPLKMGVVRLATTTALGALIGTSTGYLLGHDDSAEWDAHILAIPFTPKEINKLPCTYWPIPLK